jgi:hypothetical protein
MSIFIISRKVFEKKLHNLHICYNIVEEVFVFLLKSLLHEIFFDFEIKVFRGFFMFHYIKDK